MKPINVGLLGIGTVGGGTTIAKELVLEAIRNGKHVVTANKALLATHGTEIFAAAQKNGVMVAFEGSVGGGIPIIKALREGLAANRIEWIAGIINGTSNFILSEMRDRGLDFAAALGEAQRRGYAEADPSFDIEGVDAAHKLTILSALAFGIPMQLKKCFREGIEKLTRADIGYAEELGYRIKLLGITRRAAKGIELRVHPTLLPAHARARPAGRARRHHPHPRRLEDLDRRHGAEGARQGRELRRHRHRHPPRAGEERSPGDGEDRKALHRGWESDQDPSGRAAVVLYLSTRGNAPPRRFADIVLEGLAPDGGLYVPE